MMKGEPGTVLKAWQKMAMVLSKDLGNTKSAKPIQKAQRKILIDLCFLRLFLCAFCVPLVLKLHLIKLVHHIGVSKRILTPVMHQSVEDFPTDCGQGGTPN